MQYAYPRSLGAVLSRFFTSLHVALKERLNALKNPYAHLQMEGLTFEMIENSPRLWTRFASSNRAPQAMAPAQS
jgi:hypothetical protein